MLEMSRGLERREKKRRKERQGWMGLVWDKEKKIKLGGLGVEGNGICSKSPLDQVCIHHVWGGEKRKCKMCSETLKRTLESVVAIQGGFRGKK